MNSKNKIARYEQYTEDRKASNGYEVNRYNESDGEFMEDLLQKYIEKVDRDQSDLRRDINESEKRMQKSIDNSEQRMDKRLDKIEQMIIEQNKKIDSLADKVTDKLEDDKKYRHTNNIAIVLGVVATVAAMVGVYYATVSTITDIISLLP